jgi:hypothetical protein
MAEVANQSNSDLPTQMHQDPQQDATGQTTGKPTWFRSLSLRGIGQSKNMSSPKKESRSRSMSLGAFAFGNSQNNTSNSENTNNNADSARVESPRVDSARLDSARSEHHVGWIVPTWAI